MTPEAWVALLSLLLSPYPVLVAVAAYHDVAGG